MAERRPLPEGEGRLFDAYAALGYRLACDRVRAWGEAHRGRIALLAPEEVAARIEAWLRQQEGLDERGAAGAGETGSHPGERAVEASGEAPKGLRDGPAAMWPGASTDRGRAQGEER